MRGVNRKDSRISYQPVDVAIDRHIPAPTRRSRYPFCEMAIGDSFFVEHDQDAVSGSAASFAKYHPGYKFTTRKVRQGDRCGTRVWRAPA